MLVLMDINLPGSMTPLKADAHNSGTEVQVAMITDFHQKRLVIKGNFKSSLNV